MGESSERKPTPASEEVAERLRRLRKLGLLRGRAGLVAPARTQPGLSSSARSGIALDQEVIVPPEIMSRRLQAVVGAVEIMTPRGSCLVAESRYPLDAGRGGLTLAAALAVSSEAVAACARDDDLMGFSLRHAAFIDTETSGLGGAGTFAFMIGMGTFEEHHGQPTYVVRQGFMRHPGEEQALLHVASSVLAHCTGLVSFNGRAFDAPLLNARYLLQREPSPLAELSHFDLLGPARQRWRLRLKSCALGSLEREVLRFERTAEDVPGWLIPSLYQDYVRGGTLASPEVAERQEHDPVDGIARVFYHNREDIVSMVPLAAMLCVPFEDGGQRSARQGIHAVELVSLGRAFEGLRWSEAGEHAYRQALAQVLPPAIRAQALHRLGWLMKRQERHAEAVAIWQEWITSVPGVDPTPYEELAKHYEWMEIDLGIARKWTLWALHTAQQMPPGPRREQATAELQHRLGRLERKLTLTQLANLEGETANDAG